ncbi:MAG: molybdopterin molybdotransferase MoeA [Akkermansiaceae bacterium]
MQALISIAEAEALVRENLTPLGCEQVPLAEARGRLLRTPVIADRPSPPFDRAMMDGIALHSSAIDRGQREFTIEGIQAAGEPQKTLNNPQHCLEVMTGAVLPQGADCVIKIEDLVIDGNTARLTSPGNSTDDSSTVKSGQFIHPAGSDCAAGDVLLDTGVLLETNGLAIAASCGATMLEVSRAPTILLVTTGDEVVPPEATPLAHQIRRSHPIAITSAIEAHQLGSVSHVHVSDDRKALEDCLSSRIDQFDITLITGGISKGKYDYVAPVLKSLCGKPHFHGVSQKPGKPFAFWTYQGEERKRAIRADDSSDEGGEECKRAIRAGDGSDAGGEECKRAIFCLPGNPVSVMACLARYVLPALKKMRGEPWQPQHFSLGESFQWNAPFTGLVACQSAQPRGWCRVSQ